MDGERRTDRKSKQDRQKKTQATKQGITAGFKDFGGTSTVSVVLLADHGSLGQSRMERSDAPNPKPAQRVWGRHSQARVKYFGEMSSVSIVVFG